VPAGTQPPNRIPWPPILYASFAGLGWLLGRALPFAEAVPDIMRPIGLAVMICGLALDLSAMQVMRRHSANILPHRSATALVTSGPFAWSRNPIYLGNTVMLAGAGFAFANPWFLAMAGLAAQAVTRLAIVPEEAHLAALFGHAWRNYATRVPRWLRLPG
jgi:protein-S-isoprenylcysteine O-methyltransferase Ste14